MSKSPVSLRAAAKALGMPPTSLTRWLEKEPTLANAVQEQPGPRQAMAIDLECLQTAWTALQGGATPKELLSERERLQRERKQRVYWQGQELKQQVLALEEQHVLADEVAETRTVLNQQIRTAIETWLTQIIPVITELDQQERYKVLSNDIHGLLTSLAALPVPRGEHAPQDELLIDEHGQSEILSRIQIEHYRARLHQLKAQVHAKELIPVTGVKEKAWAEARLIRDQLLAIPARCAAMGNDPDSFRKDVIACLPQK
jgi:hypothetical protein